MNTLITIVCPRCFAPIGVKHNGIDSPIEYDERVSRSGLCPDCRYNLNENTPPLIDTLDTRTDEKG